MNDVKAMSNDKAAVAIEAKPLVREITLEELQDKINPNDPRSQLCCYYNTYYYNTYYYNTQYYYNTAYQNVQYYNTHYHNYWNLA